MAINFRLNYLESINNYIDIFLQTGMEGIIDNENLLSFSILEVTIPTTSNNTQTISISSPVPQENFNVLMFLLDTTEEAIINYSTINQFEITNNNLIITRLYNMPNDSINVILLFEKEGVNNA